MLRLLCSSAQSSQLMRAPRWRRRHETQRKLTFQEVTEESRTLLTFRARAATSRAVRFLSGIKSEKLGVMRGYDAASTVAGCRIQLKKLLKICDD